MAKLKISKIKVSIFFLIFWLLASCTSTPVLNSEKKENYNQINFIYSANTNGELEPCGCRSNPLGGVQRRMNWQKSFENKNSKSPYLIIDSGDLLFDTYPVPPALEDQKIIQAKAIIKAYNDLGIRFFTPGELDFAAGFGTFEEIIKLAKFKVISSNLYLANKPLASLYEIIELNHKKIGFLGLYDETLPLPEELHAEPFLESAKRTIAQLKAQNVEVIVALTHLGTENDEILASQYPEINYIFGSHTNQYLVEPKKIGKTLIFQPSLRSQHIGVFDNGKNYFASMSEEWNSPANHQNALDKLISNTKKEIEKINNSLFSNVSTYQEIPKYQTTNNCAKCHQPQFNFVQKTAHSKAYHALEKVHQESNLECLKCHSLGQLESGGYQTTSQLKNTKKQNFQNVQCEHCHGAGGDHPTLSVHNQIQKTPEINQCLVCHTNERAPAWYKNGVVDEIKFQENLKKLKLPKDSKAEKMKTKILAIETSCDECSASVVELIDNQVHIYSNVIFSQIELHGKFGGIVPEVASRNHLEMIAPVVAESLEKALCTFNDLAAVAVTQGPGLMGALLVGLTYAKSLAFALNIPLIPVNHLEAHLHSVFIANQKQCPKLTQNEIPILACLVSGGHTNLYLIKNLPPQNLILEKLSESRDDAAGEAFDKTAKLLGLPYPGGIHINRLAEKGNPAAFNFPRPLPGRTLEFSFSGLKTAVLLELKKQKFVPHIFGEIDHSNLPKDQLLWDFCASIQEAIVQSIVKKMSYAVEDFSPRSIAIVGGVSANTRLRQLLTENFKLPFLFPNAEYCTDNAAMIGAVAAFKYARKEFMTNLEFTKLNAYSS